MMDFSNFSDNLEGSSFTNALIIAVICFILSSLIGITYEKTSKNIERPKFFIQSLILISVPIATVMQAIGDSLAHGLGLLGALAVIRFRSTLRDPRNIVFMFASVSVGVSTGVYGVNISIIGTLLFCLMVIILDFSHLSENKLVVGFLKFDVPNDGNHLADTATLNAIDDTINAVSSNSTLLNYTIKNTTVVSETGEETIKGISMYEYKICTTDKIAATALVNDMAPKFNLKNIKLTFNKDNYEKI